MASWNVYKYTNIYQHLTVTGKVISVHTMKVFRGSKGTFPIIFNISPRWRGVVYIMPQHLYPQEINPVPT